MTLTDLRDEDICRDLDARYPLGWRVGLDEDGQLAILYRMPEVKKKEFTR